MDFINNIPSKIVGKDGYTIYDVRHIEDNRYEITLFLRPAIQSVIRPVEEEIKLPTLIPIQDRPLKKIPEHFKSAHTDEKNSYGKKSQEFQFRNQNLETQPGDSNSKNVRKNIVETRVLRSFLERQRQNNTSKKKYFNESIENDDY